MKALCAFLVVIGMAGGVQAQTTRPSTQPTTAPAREGTRVPVTISGGYETDPRDKGRPVVLVAAGLGVEPGVFRKAFSNVKPAPAGQQPDPAQVRRNKQALMAALEPHGVTNERLDEVSNYYRYRRDKGELWKHRTAKVNSIVKDRAVIGFEIEDAGAGYSSPPAVTISSMPKVKLAAKISYGKDLVTNGSISEITVVKE